MHVTATPWPACGSGGLADELRLCTRAGGTRETRVRRQGRTETLGPARLAIAAKRSLSAASGKRECSPHQGGGTWQVRYGRVHGGDAVLCMPWWTSMGRRNIGVGQGTKELHAHARTDARQPVPMGSWHLAHV